MNILILDSWLREILKTEAKPRKIAHCLSLCGPSVEKVTKKGQDWIYEIEITSNRPDMASVIGIAREAAAILPRFGIKAKLHLPQVKTWPTLKKSLPLKVKISPPSICPRFAAVVFDQVTIKPSPAEIKYRLESSGIRSLNSIVDISNYLMLETGQPIHAFDYDKINQSLMVVRLSKKGERIKTLDGVNRELPGKDIVIEDGKKRLIDLCGIMGAENSAIDSQTKRVLFFVQSYDPVKIRRTSMLLAHRTEAAVRFEKGVDEESILEVIWRGLAMAQKLAGSRLASKVYDIYPHPYKPKTLKTNLGFINSRLGVSLSSQEIKSTLFPLGFETKVKSDQFSVKIPSWRAGDMAIPEDLVEEVARIYGYHYLPSVVPEGKLSSRPRSKQIEWEDKIKDCLKHWGFTEVYNYSMVSQDLLKKSQFGHLEKNLLKLANPLTEEWVYLRPSLIPSLLETVVRNQDNFEEIKIFELANVYLPQGKNQLPKEKPRLAGAALGYSFFEIKGVVEALLEKMGIKNFPILPAAMAQLGKIFQPEKTAVVGENKTPLGLVGEVRPQILSQFGIKKKVIVFDLNFEKLVKEATMTKKYTPISQYPPIIEDLSFVVPPKTYVGEMIQMIKSTDSLIQSVELIDTFKNTRTFRITYQSQKRTLADKEVKKIREKIIQKLQKTFKAKLKGS